MVRKMCFQCDEREIGCHAKCEKYLKWKRELTKEKYNVRKQKYFERIGRR